MGEGIKICHDLLARLIMPSGEPVTAAASGPFCSAIQIALHAKERIVPRGHSKSKSFVQLPCPRVRLDDGEPRGQPVIAACSIT